MDDGPTPEETPDADSSADMTDGESSGPSRNRGDGTVDPELAKLEELRAAVEEKYDFDDFGPADMARMTPEEWDVSFDPDSWVTGPELLDRVEDELKSRIARRDVFAVLERVHQDGVQRILAYSDSGYALVYPDGTIEGRGTVLEDVKPTVALCSMPEYDPADPPANYHLPEPEAVPEQSGELGNLVMQVIALIQLVAGVVLIGAWLLGPLETLVAPAVGLIFLAIGVFLLAMVANARLSDRFRAEEYRDRLRSVHLEPGEFPDFVPDGLVRIDSETDGSTSSIDADGDGPTEVGRTGDDSDRSTNDT